MLQILLENWKSMEYAMWYEKGMKIEKKLGMKVEKEKKVEEKGE